MKWKEVHDYAGSFLLTVMCWLVVDIFVVEIPFWKFCIIDIILVLGERIHIFVTAPKSKKLPTHTNEENQFP